MTLFSAGLLVVSFARNVRNFRHVNLSLRFSCRLLRSGWCWLRRVRLSGISRSSWLLGCGSGLRLLSWLLSWSCGLRSRGWLCRSNLLLLSIIIYRGHQRLLLSGSILLLGCLRRVSKSVSRLLGNVLIETTTRLLILNGLIRLSINGILEAIFPSWHILISRSWHKCRRKTLKI